MAPQGFRHMSRLSNSPLPTGDRGGLCGTGSRAPGSPNLLTWRREAAVFLRVMEVAVISAAGITIALIAVIRLFWRRRKSLQEP